MNLKMQQDHLVHIIKINGRKAREHYQVYRRLKDLLPDRLHSLVRGTEYTKTKELRQAAASSEYTKLLHEIVDIGCSALEAKVMFETHMMLYEARQTMRLSARLKNR